MEHPKKSFYVKKLITENVLSPSIISLSRVLERWGKTRAHAFDLALPNTGCDLVWPAQEVIDVVLFGDAFSQLLNIHLWPRRHRYRLHFLSRAHRNAFSEVVGVAVTAFGVVPREELFPPSAAPMDFPDLENGKIDFIISSRLDAQKNVPAALGFLDRLRRQNPQIEVHLCGPKFLREEAEALKKSFPELDVVINGDLGPDWVNGTYARPVLISLSTSFAEDFGVSVAEAQHAGLPMILSAWGAHLDVRGKNVKLLSPEVLTSAMMESLFPATYSLETTLAGEGVFRHEELLRLSGKAEKEFGKDNLNFANRGGAVSGPLRDILVRCLSGTSLSG